MGVSLGFVEAFVISTGLTVLVSYASYYMVERPAQRLTKRILAVLGYHAHS